jgi:hypothetical protein
LSVVLRQGLIFHGLLKENTMNLMKLALLVITGILIIISVAACSGGTTTTTSTPPAAVINSDSIIAGDIQSIRPQTTGYPWELKVRISSTENVGGLPNPMADKVDQVVTVKTDENIAAFTPGQSISAKVKYAGDVPQPGIILYMYNIKLQ